MPPSTPPVSPRMPAPLPSQPQRQATLEEYALGMDQVNVELQRQSSAYAHFREVVMQLDELAKDPTRDRGQMPFVTVRFPQQGPTPGEIKLDMNALPVESLAQFRPLFMTLAASSGESLVAAWDNIHGLTDATRPIIAAAKQANV